MQEIYGKFIRPKVYSKDGTYIRSPENLVSDEGLSGYGGTMHTMNIDNEAMWLTQRNVNKDIYLVFDFGSVLRHGHMFVWNFNQQDGYLSGLKKVRIEYSINGEDYNLFNDLEFACANGKDKLKATNLNDKNNSPINFKGLSARYIKLTPILEKNQGCWGNYIEGQTRYGLSKVRFFLYREEPKKDKYAYLEALNPLHNVVTSTYGLVGDDAVTSLDESCSYISDPSPQNMDLIFDMNLCATIKGFEYINYNVENFLMAGIKNVKVSISLDSHEWNDIGSYILNKSTGKLGEKFSRICFKKSQYFRYIKLTVLGGGGQGSFGFCNGFEFRYGLTKLRLVYDDSGFYTEPARDWTSVLSIYEGWNGADGLFSVSLDADEAKKDNDNRENMFLFSDSFLGTINPKTGGRKVAYMVNNTMAYFKGNNPEKMDLNFDYGKDGKKTYDNILTNTNPWNYWMQDCVVIGSKFYVYTDNVFSYPDDLTLDEGFRFKIKGVDLLEFDIKDGKLDYSSQKIHSTPLFDENPTLRMFGCGVFANTKEAKMPNADGYIYVYGILEIEKGVRNLICSRVLPKDITNFSEYRFYDGRNWVNDMHKAVAIADDLSPEMSVMPMDLNSEKNKYAYVYSPCGVGTKISLCVGDTPFGPFENSIELYDIAKAEDLDYSQIKKVYSYNAKAHYHIAKKDEILMSYNVNTMDYESHIINGNVYRPRFLRYKQY